MTPSDKEALAALTSYLAVGKPVKLSRLARLRHNPNQVMLYSLPISD